MSWNLSDKESKLKKKLEAAEKVPRHVAAIMDGNGRWAQKRMLPRVAGHRAGIETVRDIVKVSSEMGIAYLTLYAFSSENWARPEDEVKGLMNLLIRYLKSEIDELDENEVILRAIGNKDKLPKDVKKLLEQSEEKTRNNKGLHLILALSYGAREDFIRGIQEIAENVKNGKVEPADIDEDCFSAHLSTGFAPPVDLMIRTGGEYRVSNFLLWESAYAELYFSDKMWPSFKRDDYCKALADFMNRKRRFGTLENQ